MRAASIIAYLLTPFDVLSSEDFFHTLAVWRTGDSFLTRPGLFGVYDETLTGARLAVIRA